MSSYYRLLNRLQGIRLQFRGLALYLIMLILISFFAGLIAYQGLLNLKKPELIEDTSEINKLNLELENKRIQLAAREIELRLANEANQNMQQMFVNELQEKRELETELAFYRSVMAPESFANGAAIHGLEVERGLINNQFRLKLVLTQLRKIKDPLKGYINITLIGKKEEKPFEMKLKDLTREDLKFSYRYFQVLETDFILPNDFKLDRLAVDVVVPKTRWIKGSRATKSYNVTELLIEKEKRVLLEQTDLLTDNSHQRMM